MEPFNSSSVYGVVLEHRRNLFICRTISEGSTLRLDDPILFEAVRTTKPVVILDTLIRFSESDDENAAMENKQLADSIIKLWQAGAVGVIGIHHATKAMREKGIFAEVNVTPVPASVSITIPSGETILT